MGRYDLDQIGEQVEYLYRRFQDTETESPLILKTDKAELTADEVLFLDMFAAARPLEAEKEANSDLLELLRTSIDAETVCILFPDSEPDCFTTSLAVGKGATMLSKKAISTDSGMITMALSTGEIQMGSASAPLLDEYLDRPVSSFVLCPLHENDRTLGLLMAFNKNEGFFSRSDMDQVVRAENILAKYYYFFESQNLFITTLRQRNDVRDLALVSRSDLSRSLSEIAADIVGLYGMNPSSLARVADYLKGLKTLMEPYH